MMLAQIIWWGLGLTLLYDTVETIFHWPHWLAMVLYASSMIVSAWLGVRAMTWVGLCLLPALIAILYFSVCKGLAGDSGFALWTQMVSFKAFEYLGWLLLVLGSFVSSAVILGGQYQTRKLLSFIGLASLSVGGFMMIDFALSNMQASGQSDVMFVMVQQGSYFMWLLGVSTREPRTLHEASKRRALFVFPRLPVKPIVLLLGTLLVVGYDYVAQHLFGLIQYFFVMLPPVTMMLIRRWAPLFPVSDHREHSHY